MTRWFGSVVLFCLVFAASASADSLLDRQKKYSRVRSALNSHYAHLKERFLKAGAAWAPRVFIRVFKKDGVLEVWAAPKRGQRWVMVANYPICVSSGVLGPKRFEGDLQVPEGFYHLNVFNPQSAFHLSMRVNYPNAVDRFHRVGRRSLGGDIYIHGGCASVGCVPIEDEPMEHVYLMALLARNSGQKKIPVHVFPCRMDSLNCRATLATASEMKPERKAHWRGLFPGYRAFESTRIPPRIQARRNGQYRLHPLSVSHVESN